MRIFLDLDQTLISSFPSYEKTVLTVKTREQPVEFHSNYFTYVRPLANRLVDFCQEKVGNENVYILTAAVKDYADDIVTGADFNIKKAHIFARDFVYSNHTLDRKFEDGNNILVDDLPYYDNYTKMKKLGIFRQQEKYINIEPYHPINSIYVTDEEWYSAEDKILKDVINEIGKILEKENI